MSRIPITSLITQIDTKFGYADLLKLWTKFTRNPTVDFSSHETQDGIMMEHSRTASIIVRRTELCLLRYFTQCPAEEITMQEFSYPELVELLHRSDWNDIILSTPIQRVGFERLIFVLHSPACLRGEKEFVIAVRQPMATECGYYPVLILNQKTKRAGFVVLVCS